MGASITGSDYPQSLQEQKGVAQLLQIEPQSAAVELHPSAQWFQQTLFIADFIIVLLCHECLNAGNKTIL